VGMQHFLLCLANCGLAQIGMTCSPISSPDVLAPVHLGISESAIETSTEEMHSQDADPDVVVSETDVMAGIRSYMTVPGNSPVA
jgi:hypothetical protein